MNVFEKIEKKITASLKELFFYIYKMEAREGGAAETIQKKTNVNVVLALQTRARGRK